MIVKYEGSAGEKFDLLDFRSRLKDANFHDYEWKYTEIKKKRSSKIKEFKRSAKIYDATIIFQGSYEERVRDLEKFTNISERDLLNKTPGKIWFGEYYIKVFVVAARTYPGDESNRTIKTASFLCPNPFWIREKQIEYLPKPEVSGEENKPPVISGEDSQHEVIENNAVFGEFGFDLSKKSTRKVRYPLFDLPFDFAGIRGQAAIENQSFTESNFVMTIYGFADTPSVLIAGHPYTVHATVYEGERIVIDSSNRTVIKIGRLGEITNLYNSRGKQYSVFQKIPFGVSPVSWSGAYGIDILLKDERSEPEWSL